MIVTRNNEIWVSGTQSGQGILRYDYDSLTLKGQSLDDVYVSSMAVVEDAVWMGTLTDRVLRRKMVDVENSTALSDCVLGGQRQAR